MMLERMARSVFQSYGLLHQSNLRALRGYIKTTSEKELIQQVAEIKDAALLRTLWEAGLSSGLQGAVLERLKEI